MYAQCVIVHLENEGNSNAMKKSTNVMLPNSGFCCLPDSINQPLYSTHVRGICMSTVALGWILYWHHYNTEY